MSENENESALVNLPDVERYPLDVRRLAKGQTLTQDECVAITGVRPDHRSYPFALMELRELIVRDSAREGINLSVAIRGGGLHINTDAEASNYHAKLLKEAERSIFRNGHMLRSTVDVGKLTDAERSQHDRRVAISAMKSQALRATPTVITCPDPSKIEG